MRLSVFAAAIITAVFFLAVSTAQATLIAYEPFDYQSETYLYNCNGGTDWNGAWCNAIVPEDGEAIQNIASPGLTHSDLSVAGNKANLAGSSNGASYVYRKLSHSYTSGDLDFSGDLYFSFLGEANNDNVLAWGVSLATVGNTSNNSIAPLGNLVGGITGAPDTSPPHFCLSETSAVSGVSTFPTGTVSLVVAKFNLATGDAQMYVFPTGSTISSTPGTPAATLTGAGSMGTINGIRIYAIGGDNAANVDIDEIRVGTEFADVVPEPSALVLLAIGGGIMAVYSCRRRKRA